MTLEIFAQAPWRNSHVKYKESTLSINPAPEYASSEVLVASLYRSIGYPSLHERDIHERGTTLQTQIQQHLDQGKPSPDGATLAADVWAIMLHGVLASPKQPNQSMARSLQVTPITPTFAEFSGSPRLRGNPWTPGSLIRRMIWLGSPDHDSAATLWRSLFDALSVNDDDDVFARWLDKEAHAWMAVCPTDQHQWSMVEGSALPSLSPYDFNSVRFLPARQFTKDLEAVIAAKKALTRRQWISLLDAIVRLAAVSHVMWLCAVHERMWDCLTKALEGAGPQTKEEALRLLYPPTLNLLPYGGKALNALRDTISAYLIARLGINCILWALEDAGKPFKGAISSADDLKQICKHVHENRQTLLQAGIRSTLSEIRESEARTLTCKRGVGSNMLEFARHALGQRQSAAPLLRGYDQGYVLRKKGSNNNAPWVVSLGPVSVIALVHCSLFGASGPRSIHVLREHLAAYGVLINRNDITKSDLGHQLRMLGLVLDSPDAESGMLLTPPFPTSQSQNQDSNEHAS